jgi:hypothetical protein
MSEQTHKVDDKLKQEIEHGKDLKHVSTHVDDPLVQAKLQLELKKGAKLEHVTPPSTEVSDELKKAFIEDQKEKSK